MSKSSQEDISFVDGDPIPSVLTKEQISSFFPNGLRGLRCIPSQDGAATTTADFVFPDPDGSIHLIAGAHYTQQVTASNSVARNNNNNQYPPLSPSQPRNRQTSNSTYTILNNNNVRTSGGRISNQNSNNQIPPQSPRRILEDSDEEIGVIINSPDLSQRSNNNDDSNKGHHNQQNPNDNNNNNNNQNNQNNNMLRGQPAVNGIIAGSQLVVRRGKLMMDRVHDHIMLPPLVCRIVDSPEFQRLRYLKQLGSTAYLYPGATHTRFEHSVGVCHLAGLMAKKIARRQPELQVTDLDVLCIMVAGLCHDLGHGPFSHLFEVVVNESLKRGHESGKVPPTSRKRWNHEEMSTTLVRRIFKRLREENDETVAFIEDEDINFIVLAIDGLRPGQPWPEASVNRDDNKRFLLDIVANKRNGIDVDKLDYFMRDSLACYGKAAIDIHISRLINSCRAIRFEDEMQICFEEKMALSLGDIFSVRAKLHKYAYQHRMTKVVDHMIKDALMLAEPHFLVRSSTGKMITMIESVDDPEGFMLLGDWILNAIAASNSPELESARQVIHRLHTRQLFAMVGAAQISSDRVGSKEAIRSQILDRWDAPDEETREKLEKTLIVDFVKITYGSSDSKGQADDPISHVTFFNPKGDIDKAFVLPEDRRNPLFQPMAFHEKAVLVLVRDKEYQSAAIDAFDHWKKTSLKFLETAIPNYNSPAPNRRQREGLITQQQLMMGGQSSLRNSGKPQTQLTRPFSGGDLVMNTQSTQGDNLGPPQPPLSQ